METVKFSDYTLKNIKRLEELLGEHSCVQILAEGVSVYLDLVEAVKSGKKIILEDKDGGREIVKIKREI